MRLLLLFMLLTLLLNALTARSTDNEVIDLSGTRLIDNRLYPKEHNNHNQIRNELDFVLYLIGRENYDESIFLLERLRPSEQQWIDSINYLTGWIFYRQKKLEISAGKLLLVSEESPVFHKSRFFGAYNLAYLGDFEKAASILSFTPVEQESLNEAMQNFQLAGIHLLERDYDTFKTRSSEFAGKYHVMAREERRLNEYYQMLYQNREASPVMAGLLSSVIPGLGRVYAGKTAEGIVSFLYMTAFGLTTWDFYRGAGVKSPFFILSATVSAVFYAGNIIGSAAAARRTNNEFRHEMDQRILFDLHIPLRNAFN